MAFMTPSSPRSCPTAIGDEKLLFGGIHMKINSSVVMLIWIAIACGCSGSSNNPLIPIDQGAYHQLTDGTAQSPLSQEYIWGYYSLYFDIENRKVEVVASRSVDFTVNVVKFLNNDPHGLKVKINSTTPGTGYVDLDIDITLKHPMGTVAYNGYDVRGIFIGNGSAHLKSNADLIYPVTGTDQILLNADGYTRWFNPSEFQVPNIFGYVPGKLASKGYSPSATLNPYKYFGEALEAGDNLWDYFMANSANEGYFIAGTSNTRNYKLRFPTPAPGIKYGYVVTANWSGTKPENHPSHAPEPVGLRVVDNSDLWFVDSSHKGGNIVLDISVFDWDAELTGGVMQAYQIKIESKVLTSVHTLTTSEMTPTASGTHWFTYHVEIPADNQTSANANEMWIVVEDSNADYTNPLGVPNTADGDKIAACFRYPLTVSNIEPVWVQVNAPNGGEVWKAYDSQDIMWTATSGITNLKIELSLDSGANYTQVIVASTPNDGTFTWNPIPSEAVSDHCRIRISDVDNPLVEDASDADFGIAMPGIEVSSPNGGEVWKVYESKDITWTSSTGITNVKIELSLDSGANYTQVIVASTPNDGTFTWNPIPSEAVSDHCRIRISDVANAAVNDTSDADFTVQPLATIHVTSPNGGEKWQVLSVHNITWDVDPSIANVKIELSLDSGGSYPQVIAASTLNDGTFEWNPIPPEAESDYCRIRMSDVDNPLVKDESDADYVIHWPSIHVLIPNGGESWEVGSSHEITWESSETGGTVSIAYSKDSFMYTSHVIVPDAPNDGSYLWDTIPSDPSSTVEVAISLNGTSPVIRDYSDGFFSITLPPPSITVLTPNGGEVLKAGHSFEITWTSVNVPDPVNIWYSKDNFQTDFHQIVSATDNDGSYLWDPIPRDLSDTVRVEVDDGIHYDISDADFTLADSGWARTWGGSTDDIGQGVAVDGYGNTYVTGYFQGTVDFDPSATGVDSHTSSGGYDAFLSKFDPSGNFMWTHTWGGSGHDIGYGVAVDAGGYASVTGLFSDTVDFDPGIGVDEHASNGTTDAFLCMYDPTGVFQFAVTWGGSSYDWGRGIGLGTSGNVYVTGHFYGTVDFDPKSGVDNHTSNGNYDIYLSKFDSWGHLQWANTWGGSEDDYGNSVAVDAYNSAYITGYFKGTADFDPGSGVEEHTSSGYKDIFLSKFDSTGAYVGANTFGGSDQDEGIGVAADVWGNVYLTGYFSSTVDFGGDSHTSNGYDDVFLSKFDSNLLFKWTRTWGGSYTDEGRGIAVDILGHVYVSGEFWFMVDFDPAGGVDNHISNGEADIFLSQFDSDGYYLLGRNWGGTVSDKSLSVAADGSGNAYATGSFMDTVDFDPGSGVDNHTSNGTSDIFLTKFLPDGNW
jgi:hypothetical protein